VWVATLARAGRVRDVRRVVSARFDDAEENLNQAGSAPASILQEASIYSSDDQSSF
jgi:hypothetical protein